METDLLSSTISYTLPALITGLTAAFVIKKFLANSDKRAILEMKRDSQKQLLPIKLQAFERMTLFLERIEPSKLLLRVAPNSTDKNQYRDYLIASIQQEYEHNLVQQIYISDQCWGLILTAKNSIIKLIKDSSSDTNVADANQLREIILTKTIKEPAASISALRYIKTEVRSLF
ncbi:MAG: hypothetical protein COB98_05285 [Flavobacteriaceae bacterium]|nr:MAG: hypothetical protein COB98_05285 [Flavobacteriaceae bacterium]